MFLDVVVLGQKSFNLVKENEELLGKVWEQEEEAMSSLGLSPEDFAGVDYRTLGDGDRRR